MKKLTQATKKVIKLIKLKDKFILVSDERLIHPDKGYTFFDGQVVENCVGAKKIIAGIPELPSIDFSDLKEKDCKEIGYVDVEKLAEKILLSHRDYKSEGFSEYQNGRLNGIIEGLETDQSLNDKMFSLEQMKEAMNKIVCSTYVNKGDNVFDLFIEMNRENYINEYIQSLQQTSWDVEVEMEYQDMHGMWFTKPTILSELDRPSRPKITNNSIKITKIL